MHTKIEGSWLPLRGSFADAEYIFENLSYHISVQISQNRKVRLLCGFLS